MHRAQTRHSPVGLEESDGPKDSQRLFLSELSLPADVGYPSRGTCLAEAPMRTASSEVLSDLNVDSTDWKWLPLVGHTQGFLEFCKAAFRYAHGTGTGKATLANINQKALKVSVSFNLVPSEKAGPISTTDH